MDRARRKNKSYGVDWGESADNTIRTEEEEGCFIDPERTYNLPATGFLQLLLHYEPFKEVFLNDQDFYTKLLYEDGRYH